MHDLDKGVGVIVAGPTRKDAIRIAKRELKKRIHEIAQETGVPL